MSDMQTLETPDVPPELPSRQPTPALRPAAELGAIVAIGVAFALGALLVLAPLIWLVMPTTPLPAPFPDTHQDAETLVYVLMFLVAVPAGIAGSMRLAGRVSSRPNAACLPAVAALLLGGIAAVLAATRISKELPWGGGPGVLAAGGALWWICAAMLLSRATSSSPSDRLASAARRAGQLWAVTGVLVAGVVLSFTDLEEVRIGVVAVGLVMTAAVLLARPIHVPRPSRRVGIVLDVAVVAVLALAVPNLVVILPGGQGLLTSYQRIISQFHQDFFLGPANQLLHGDAMLVNVLSQYGVGSIYFLAGVFLVLPIGNGTLGLVEGVLSALMFIGVFATMRIAGVSRLIAAAAMTFAVVALVYGLDYPLGALLQHGAIRFGLPVGVVLGAVAESRWPRAKRWWRALLLITVAVASIWALEAFAYTTFTALAVATFHVATVPRGRRRSEVIRWVAQLATAIVAAHLVFAVATLVATGSLPDWGWYLHTLREFLGGTVGDWTYDFSSFSWGLLIGGWYVVSAVATATVVIRRREIVRRHRTMMLAVTAMTAWGIALFSYLVNRSADHIIPYVCLPAVALGALWLAVLRLPELGAGPRARRVALAGAVFVATIWISFAWPTLGTRASESALAYALPGGKSLSGGIQALLDRPIVQPDSVDGQRLLAQYAPGEQRSIVLTKPDTSIEILMRAGRGSAVPFGDPVEDSFVPDGHFDALDRFVARLEGGEKVVLDPAGRAAFNRYRGRPRMNALLDIGSGVDRGQLAPLQRWVLRKMGQRFDLRTIARTPSGMEVAQLVARRPAG